MKAVLVDKETHHLFVGEWEDPVMGEGDILVSVQATALNRADLLQKIGKYPPPPGESTIMGLEMAGVVEAVGSTVKQWAIGDKVCSLLPGGGYAAKVKVPAGLAIRIPEGLSFEEAAAIPEVFLTAFLNIFLLGGLQPGQIVLVHAAGGGVGPAAIQLVKQFGAQVIATVRSDEKVAACLRFGADLAINTSTDDFAAKVNTYTGNLGVNVILDPVGSAYFESNLQCLATEGKLLLIGLMGGHSVPSLDLRTLILRRWQLIGSTLRALPVARKTEIVQAFTQQFMPMFSDGRLTPTIDSVFEVSAINEAHARMEHNLNIGKIIVRMNF
jgi:putative PIG3 family NAD(P)H quinone oxidoreductase